MIYSRTGEMAWTLTADSNWERCLLDLMECSNALNMRLYERKSKDSITVYCEDGDYMDALLEKFASELMEEAENFNKHFGDHYEI